MARKKFSARDNKAIEVMRQFAEEHLANANIDDWYDAHDIPLDVQDAYNRTILGKMGLAPELGGPKISFPAQIEIVRTLGAMAGAIAPFTWQYIAFVCTTLLANETQAQTIIDRFERRGCSAFACAISEPTTGSSFRSYYTRVTERDGRLLLNGDKAFVPEGLYSEHLLVLAKDFTRTGSADRAPFRFYLVPTYAEGVSSYRIEKRGQRIVSSDAFHFEDVEIQPEWVMGGEDISAELERVIAVGRLIVCANSVGMAEAAFEDALQYAAHHEIGGTSIGEFQQIGLLLTQMKTDLMNMEAQLEAAVEAWDENSPDRALKLALAKAFIPKTAGRVASAAMQVLGGMGYTENTRVGRIWLDARGNEFSMGTEQVMVNIATRELLQSVRKGDDGVARE